ISLPLLVTLMTGGAIVGAFTNDRTIAANAVRQGARLAAALGDGLGTGISTTDADQQIADAVAAPSRQMAFGQVFFIEIYDPGDQALGAPPMSTDGSEAGGQSGRNDTVYCNAERKDKLVCNQPGSQGWPIQERRREYPDERAIGVRMAWIYRTPGGMYQSNN